MDRGNARVEEIQVAIWSELGRVEYNPAIWETIAATGWRYAQPRSFVRIARRATETLLGALGLEGGFHVWIE